MKKVTVEPGCITCGLCEFIAPDIFEITDRSYVKPAAPLSEHEKAIKEAALLCPVQVISYEQE